MHGARSHQSSEIAPGEVILAELSLLLIDTLCKSNAVQRTLANLASSANVSAIAPLNIKIC
jgi:hypothetical protein